MQTPTRSQPASISIFFPAYNDGATIASLVLRAVDVATRLTLDFEVIIVNDGSSDATLEIADELTRTYPQVRAVHHPHNRGYGGALRTGFASATKDVIAYTDGDAQYDPREFEVLWNRLSPDADVVAGYKISRSDPWYRIIIGRVYHHTVKILFRLQVRDVDCDFRLLRREVFDRVTLERDTGVICLEMMLQNPGRRPANRRGPGPPLPPHARPVAILQLPSRLPYRRRRPETLDDARCSRPRSELLASPAPQPDGRRRGAPGIDQEMSTQPPTTGGDYRTFYRNRRVMITGGLGFIGSTLAHQLVALKARVLIVDSLISDYGGNPFNIVGIEDRVHVNTADVRQSSTMNRLVRDQEVIFNLAGQVSHIDSMEDPYTDLEINCRAQLSILEACRRFNPAVKVVFAGTRQVYGRPESLPVTEQHLVKPTDVNGINKAAGEYYHLVYNDVFGVRACSLRLTNVYGPRQLMKHNRQGFIAWFLRLALTDQEIQIFGDGTQLRDFVFVDDAAHAFLRAGAHDSSNGRVFNVGGLEPIAHRDLVKQIVSIAGTGRHRCVEWPPEKKAIDIGDFYADSSLSERTFGWRPTTPLADGLARTLDY